MAEDDVLVTDWLKRQHSLSGGIETDWRRWLR